MKAFGHVLLRVTHCVVPGTLTSTEGAKKKIQKNKVGGLIKSGQWNPLQQHAEKQANKQVLLVTKPTKMPPQ